jgi:3-hydroxyisobutyrate dehydrogenase-like beta-hydroxyacid dehydrogenase
MSDEHETIGFVGLGRMGGNMAARYLAAGYPVHGEARSRAHAEKLLDEGLIWHETAREVAESVDVILSSIPNDDVLREVASGPDGIVAGLEAGKTWVDVSTVSPSVSREVAEQVRAAGALMLDAPVSGSVPQVQSGTLTIMVGGDKDAYQRVARLLRVLGTPTYIGRNGHGLILKLAINISLAVQMQALSEGLLMAERDGVPRELALEVMTESPIGSPMLKARVPLLLDLPEEAWFDIDMTHKDIRLALQAADELHVSVPSAHVADEALTQASELGYGNRDLAALHEALAKESDARVS